MATTPNREQERVAAQKAERDNSDGFDRGSLSPYPKEKEALILANISKVSPAFVKGYWEGRRYDEQAVWDSFADEEWCEEQLTIEDAMRFRSGRKR